jgi:hypothetical protein
LLGIGILTSPDTVLAGAGTHSSTRGLLINVIQSSKYSATSRVPVKTFSQSPLDSSENAGAVLRFRESWFGAARNVQGPIQIELALSEHDAIGLFVAFI